jgi:hypothetical protein
MLIQTVVHICLACSSWDNTTFPGTSHKTQVNTVLGNLVRMHYPGEVTQSGGTISPATCWDDYALAPNTTYGSAQGAMWSNFWVSFSVILFQSFIRDAPNFATP